MDCDTKKIDVLFGRYYDSRKSKKR